MADTYFPESATYDENVRMIQNGDPVDGGTDGPVNIALQAVVDRTGYLKSEIEKINSKEIGTSGIADKAITTTKIADSAVTTEKIADGATTNDKLADNTITAAKIADSAITAAKIDMDSLESALGGGTSGDTSFIVAGVAASPNYYNRSELFYTDSDARTTLSAPATIWLNIDDKGYAIKDAGDLDISLDATWSANAQEWQASHDYALNDVIYPLTGRSIYYYRCITAGTSSTLEPTFPTTIGTTYNDGNCQWICELDYTIAANRAGKDFYLYACIPSGDNATPVIKLSANSTVPVGYTASTSRKIGGFHCLCADVGTIDGHALTDYVAGDILPTSVWDLQHRPKADPEGMVYVDGIDMWVDIYLASWDGSQLVSVYGNATADGTSTKPFHGELFAEEFGLIKKQNIFRDHFIVAAKGSNENTAIKGAADATTTGGHVDTAGRRMISNYGIEDCCGLLEQWTNETNEYYPGSSIASNSDGEYLSGYSWRNGPVYHSSVDSQRYGSCYGFLRRGLVGGYWGDGSSCGSRAFLGANVSVRRLGSIGGRGASEPLAS